MSKLERKASTERTERTDARVRLSIFVPLELVMLWIGFSASGEAKGTRVLGLRPAWYAIFAACFGALVLANLIARRPVFQSRTSGEFAAAEMGAAAVFSLAS